MEDALLAAICAQPDDVAVRLVYADYLLEQSDPAKRERGEFILAQCRGDGGGLPVSPIYPIGPYRSREGELLAKHRDAWLAPLAGLVSNAAFSRGFPDRVTMTVDQFADKFDAVSRLTPVARLHLTGAAPVLAELAEFEQFRGVVGLDLSREHVSSVGLREFLASPHLARLNYLNLGDNLLGDAGANVLAESPALKRLQFLGVARSGLTSATVSRLVTQVGVAVPGLRWLNVRGNPLAPGTWADALLNWLPPKMHPALRLSLEGQLRRFRLTKVVRDPGPLPRLKAATLPPEFAAWVKALDISQSPQLVTVLRANPLPPDVRTAFVKVCERRCEFADRRDLKGDRLPERLPPPGDGPGDLAEFVREVARYISDARFAGAKRETDSRRWGKNRQPEIGMWLRDTLLTLLEHHAAGTLDPEGRTR